MPYMLNVRDSDYHGKQAVSFHFLLDLEDRGPAYAIGRLRGSIGRRESDAFRLGRLVHLTVLEGADALRERTACVPATYVTEPERKPWNTRAKYCKEWAAANPGATPPADYLDGTPEEKPWNWNAGACKAWGEAMAAKGLDVLSSDEAGLLVNMRQAATSVPAAAGLLRMGIPELSVFQDEGGVPVKSRLDWIACTGPAPEDWQVLADLKTCDNINGFVDDAERYHYVRQLAFYRWMIGQDIGRQLPAALLAVEKCAPHRVRVYDIPADMLDEGHDRNMRALDLACNLWRSDSWPMDLEPSRQDLRRPAWREAAARRDAMAEPY